MPLPRLHPLRHMPLVCRRLWLGGDSVARPVAKPAGRYDIARRVATAVLPGGEMFGGAV